MIFAILIGVLITGGIAAAEADTTCVSGKHPTRDGVMYVGGPYGTMWRCSDEDIAAATARYNARGK